MKRRELLIGMAAMSTGPLLMSCDSAKEASSGRRIESVGIQLYTVRNQMALDMPGTLQRLADIGYRELEFAGYFDRSPADVRAMLGDMGLSAPSTHTSIDAMRGDVDRLIEGCLTIGHRYLVLGWLSPEERQNLDQYKTHAELCNQVGEKCAKAGIQFGYHNHDFEFESLDGMRPIDLLLKETDSSLVKFEIDLYWITKAGGDPFAYFEKHPGRFPLCHVKDLAEDGGFADVGSGTIDFAAIFAASEQAGLQHYFVERDESPNPLQSAANSYAAVSKLRF
jgi:sugar phosphate isomerase/epimerase